jgi:hypothetical protein
MDGQRDRGVDMDRQKERDRGGELDRQIAKK